MAQRVLVVDDEVGLCSVLSDVLEMEGYEVEVCHDVSSANRALGGSRFDATILDVFITDQPVGIDLGRRVIEDSPETKLFFMTGYADESDIRKGIDSGAFAVIKKPFILDDVVRVVGMALGERIANP